MSIFSKARGAEPQVTYERFELPTDPPFPDSEANRAPPAAPAVQPTSDWRPAAPEPTTLLVPVDSVIEGTLRSQGQVRVEGILRGDVHAPTVLLAANGRIEGRVFATFVTVTGVLQGIVVAREIALSRTANVDAEMTYDEISIERGARVRGLHRQREPEPTNCPNPTTTNLPSTAGLTVEAELALQDLVEVAGAAAKAAADLATDGIKSLAELEAHLRSAGTPSSLATVAA